MLFRSGRKRQNIRDGLGVVLLLLVVGQAVSAAVRPELLAPVGTIYWQGGVISQSIGAALLFGGLILLLIGHINLGASWRIGIEEAARPGLVTTGLYSICRNPIFLAMLVTLTGFTVLLPTWLSLVMLVGAIVGIRQQALEEEAYLLSAYGDDYRAYGRGVGRFLPGVGRLR
jgi:protein-S-isoprenylcysteine O-methyltransferase Ste14